MTQLTTFFFNVQRLSKTKLTIPQTWLDAFLQLITVLDEEKNDRKRIIFFDELPWLATHRSGFLKAFGFWSL